MTNIKILVYRCTNKECGLRFSAISEDMRANRCPICWQPTKVVAGPYPRSEVNLEDNPIGVLHLEVLLDNIRSAWNVGAMLRSSDGAGVKHVHLGGVTPGPEHPKVAKTGLGAETALPITRQADGFTFCKKWRDENGNLWALEGGNRAQSLFNLTKVMVPEKVLLVVGNELTGVDPEILEICDQVYCLPMAGYKGSLNVAVAFGIAVYTLRYGIK